MSSAESKALELLATERTARFLQLEREGLAHDRVRAEHRIRELERELEHWIDVARRWRALATERRAARLP